MPAQKYVSLPNAIQAIQYTDDTVEELRVFAGGYIGRSISTEYLLVYDALTRKWAKLWKGDWLIKTPQGVLHPCIHAVFCRTYLLLEVPVDAT